MKAAVDITSAELHGYVWVNIVGAGIKAFVLANLVTGHALCGQNSQFGNVPSFSHQHIMNLYDDA